MAVDLKLFKKWLSCSSFIFLVSVPGMTIKDKNDPLLYR
jgi:hypothetical protein